MPSDTYILTISEAGVSVPSSHASTHITGGSDIIPTATSTTSGLMSATIYNQHVTNTAKVSNVTHTGDVTDSSGVLTVNKINGVSMAGLATGILKNTTGTGVPSIAVAGDFPTLNQNTSGNAATATLATTATNIAGGSAGSVPYQTGSGATSLLNAGTAGYVLTANGSSAPSWAPVSLSSGTSGTLPVASGGTGTTTFTAGVLKANGTSAFTTVTAPTGDIVGTTDTQTLTNKTFGAGTALGTPVSGTLSGCTGLPLTTGVTGTLPVANGGTGQTSYTIGDLLYASGTTALSKLADIDTGNVLLSGGVASAPSYGKVGLTTHVSGILPVANGGTGSSSGVDVETALVTGVLPATKGGTGQSSYAVGDLLYAGTTSTVSKLADVATGNVLISGGVDTAPSYGKVGLTTHVSGTLPVANGGTGQTSVVRGQIYKLSGFGTFNQGGGDTPFVIPFAGTLNTSVTSNMVLGATDTFAIKNDSGSTRIFRVEARVQVSSTGSDLIQIGLYSGVAGSLTLIEDSLSEGYCFSTGTVTEHCVTLQTSSLISIPSSHEIAIYIVNLSSFSTDYSVARAFLSAEAIL